MKDSVIYLDDILESIERISEYVDGVTLKRFLAAPEKQDAVLRRLEIIGEAVKHVPVELRETRPAVPWKSIAGLRDVVIHSYANVDNRRVWKVVKKDLPILEREIRSIMADLERKE
ncbi:MAG: DUF86 domain-containing protein [Euryarchaeota archaeon]|nr:DUF86 domain-containing protein [Euryarchaeota archaeon]